MRGVLAEIKHWSPESIGALTPRQARRYYNDIPKIQRMLTGEVSEQEESSDMDDILDEAEYLGIPTPPRDK